MTELTDKTDLLAWLRKARTAIYAAVDEASAADIADGFDQCITRITEQAAEIDRLREVFRIDGELHANAIKAVQHEQDARLEAYKAEIDRIRNALRLATTATSQARIAP